MKTDNKTYRNALAALLAGSSLMMAAPAQATCSSDPYMGSVCITAATFCPRGYVEAQGQMLAISSYTALYSLLGDVYGGDGRTTFGIPDLRGRTPVGQGYGSGLTPVNPGAIRGYERVTLSSSQLPPHHHTATFTPSASSTATVKASTNEATKPVAAAGDYIASNKPMGGVNKFVPASGIGTTVDLGGVSGGGSGGDVTVNNTGGGQSLVNLPPQLGMRYCLATVGLFPPRN